MIYGSIANAGRYFRALPGMASAFRFYSEKCARGIECGNYEIGSGIRAIVQDYETKDREDSFFEAHRRYIDIQIVLKGSELSLVSNIDGCVPLSDYDPDKDLQKFRGGDDAITLREGLFAVFFPEDVHMPGICRGMKKGKVKKVVFKIPVKNSPARAPEKAKKR